MTPILLLAEARGEHEARHDSTLIGPSGALLLAMLSESRILDLSPGDHDLLSLWFATSNSKHLIRIWDAHPELHRTNVFNLHPPANDLNHFLGPKPTGIPHLPQIKLPKARTKTATTPGGSFVQREFEPELDRLGDEIIQHNPNIIICLGNVALWAMAGLTGIGKLRGTTLLSTNLVTGYKLLPTYHPAAVFRNYDLRATIVADLSKAARESAYADVRRPEREIWIEPTLEDIHHFLTTHVRGCDLLSVDIETSGDRITCIGFAPNSRLALVIPFDDPRTAPGNYWPSKQDEEHAWNYVKATLADPTILKLFQNGAYDITFLWRSMKIKVLGAAADTMLAHHALQPEALKSLGFLGSIYSDEGAWKDMRKAKTTIKRDS